MLDNCGNYFDGVMIDTGKDELIDKPIPLYQSVVIATNEPSEIICTKCGLREERGEKPKSEF